MAEPKWKYLRHSRAWVTASCPCCKEVKNHRRKDAGSDIMCSNENCYQWSFLPDIPNKEVEEETKEPTITEDKDLLKPYVRAKEKESSEPLTEEQAEPIKKWAKELAENDLSKSLSFKRSPMYSSIIFPNNISVQISPDCNFEITNTTLKVWSTNKE